MRRNFLLLVVLHALALSQGVIHATAIIVSPPVMLDTSAVYQESGVVDRVWPIAQAFVARGENVDLQVIKGTNALESWSLIRMTPSGALIDTMSRALPGSGPNDTSFLFTPFGAYWIAPHFYILGTYHRKSGPADSIAYVRVEESGKILDALPRVIDKGLIGGFTMILSGHYLWYLNPYYMGPIKIRLWDMESGQVLVGDTGIYGNAGTWAAATADSDGLLIAALSNGSRSLYNFRVSNSGQVTVLDSVPLGHSFSRLYGFGASQYGADSALVYFLDTTSTGGAVLRTYKLPHEGNSVAPLKDSIVIPSYVGGRFYREALFLLGDKSLKGMGTEFTGGKVDLVSFDLTTGTCELIERDSIKDVRGPIFDAYLCTGNQAALYVHSVSGMFQTRWDWTNPSGTISTQGSFLRGEPLRCPTITTDSNGTLVYGEVCRFGNRHLRGYRIPNGAGGVIANRYDIMEGGKPHYPSLVHLGNGKGLIWNEDITDSIKLENSDTTVQHRLVQFSGDVPSSEAIRGARRMGRSYRSYFFRPQVAVRDSFLYVANIYYPWFDGYDDSVHSYLAIVNTGGTDTTTYVSTPCNGQPVLVPHASAVDWIGSWIYCSSYSNLACLSFWGGYHVNAITGTVITGKPQLGQGTTSLSGLPNDVATAVTDSGTVVVTSKDARVWRYEEKWEGYFLMAELGAYLPSGRFHDARLYPVSAGAANAVIAMTSDKRNLLLLVFDAGWTFVDSLSIPLKGIPMDISEFAYDAESHAIVFAYSAYFTEPWAAPQFVFQAVKIDDVTDAGGGGAKPNQFAVAQNYPNPFNGGTTIAYSLPSRSNVDLDIFNVLGQRVWTRHLDGVAAGSHVIVWDGRTGSGKEAASGVYFYRLTAGGQVASKKMLLLK